MPIEEFVEEHVDGTAGRMAALWHAADRIESRLGTRNFRMARHELV
jgi:hypothetical protein